MSDLVVRPRNQADLPALSAVLTAQQPGSRYPLRWPLPFPVEDFIARTVDLAAWTAESGDRVVGHVAVQRVDDVFSPGGLAEVWSEGHGRPVDELGILGTLFVDPSTRGSGLGRRLHDTAVDWIRGEGLAPCLDVVPTHGPALAMYERIGWREVARVRPPWLPEDQPDVVAMVLS